jgi:hypothetical protein
LNIAFSIIIVFIFCRFMVYFFPKFVLLHLVLKGYRLKITKLVKWKKVFNKIWRIVKEWGTALYSYIDVHYTKEIKRRLEVKIPHPVIILMRLLLLLGTMNEINYWFKILESVDVPVNYLFINWLWIHLDLIIDSLNKSHLISSFQQ